MAPEKKVGNQMQLKPYLHWHPFVIGGYDLHGHDVLCEIAEILGKKFGAEFCVAWTDDCLLLKFLLDINSYRRNVTLR